MIVKNHKSAVSLTVGGKAKSLLHLDSSGFPVPEFVIIPAEVFDPVLIGLPATENGSNRKCQELLDFSLSEIDQEELRQILHNWNFPEQPVVVRSSVADEDGSKDAFPGIMDSFLNLRTMEGVFEAIAKCTASTFSETSIAYRKQRGLSFAARPAVILQKQVQPVASGVMYTTFPDYPQELAVHATWGFGTGLVEGILSPDEFYLSKSKGTLHRQVLRIKDMQFVQSVGEGLKQVGVAAEHQEVVCLSEKVLQELYRAGRRLEHLFKKPQDVEFVVTEEQIYIVQSRPVTQGIPEIVIYDNTNIQESYCGVTTPLTFSFASRAYATVYRQTMEVLSLPKKTIQAHEHIVAKLLGLVQGRIYYNINNWYKGLQLLPSFRQNKADMERMMGLEEPVDFVQDREMVLFDKIMMLPWLVLNLGRLLFTFFRLPKLVPDFHQRFQQHYHRFYQQNLSELSLSDLKKQKELLDRELLQNWTTPIINDFYVMMTNGSVARKLKKAGIQNTGEFLSRFLSGDHLIESAQPTRDMQVLAVEAWKESQLRELILFLPSDIHEQVKVKFPEFYEKVLRFINKFGDRTVGELKLETQTMRLKPYIFYQYLRNYLSGDKPPVISTTNTQLHEAAKAELKDLLNKRTILFRSRTRKSLKNLQQAIRNRESLRLERTRLFGMYRALYLAIGEQLVQQQKLRTARDIFYLSEDEIKDALSYSHDQSFIRLVADRVQEFEGYRKVDVPSRVVVPSPPINRQENYPENPDQLFGTGCFQGIVTGEVIVIKEPGDDLQVAGKIVCALRTDPGWAALFPNCAGVLIEKGSSLSHSVILLRELNIPTIINVPGLTKCLQTGQRVLMNGITGEINKLA